MNIRYCNGCQYYCREKSIIKKGYSHWCYFPIGERYRLLALTRLRESPFVRPFLCPKYHPLLYQAVLFFQRIVSPREKHK